MRIVTARRISQSFFLALFFWFCLVTTLGDQWWRLRGWPVNWILSLDPLTALSTVFSTGTLYAPLAWALACVVLTVFVGRFFCGFACPMGALNQFVGWLSLRKAGRRELVEANRARNGRTFKYFLLIFLLGCALTGSVQSGLFDPLPLLFRSVNLTLTPLADHGYGVLYDGPRFYAGAWLTFAVLAVILALNLVVPRFFCRFLCPLGALFGLLSRFAPWRIGKSRDNCGDCRICEERCEGACTPSGRIVTGECLMCMNCLDRCPAGRIGFSPKASAGGEAPLPDIGRRGVVLGAAGLLAGPLWRVGAVAASDHDPGLIRPPGSLDEERFLARCIRCGQCMRICPGNLLQPDFLRSGIQGLWTPTANFRIGRSGCQPNCVACGQVCPTAAIRPLTQDEKFGLGDFTDQGPVRMGLALVDRTRCLPWAMDRPCIVCQELCPVSPKAIYTRTSFEPVRGGRMRLTGAAPNRADLPHLFTGAPNLAGGDYALRPAGDDKAVPRRIVAASGTSLHLEQSAPPEWTPTTGDEAEIVVRLQRPYVDPARCVGCGMCEHECPVSGLRAIRITSENESRSRQGRMLL